MACFFVLFFGASRLFRGFKTVVSGKKKKENITFMEKGRHFLSVCYGQTTRKAAPFHPIGRGKNSFFQVFFSHLPGCSVPLKWIIPWATVLYENVSYSANLQSTTSKNEKCSFYRGTLSELFKNIHVALIIVSLTSHSIFSSSFLRVKER